MKYNNLLMLTDFIKTMTDDTYLKSLNFTFDDEVNNCLIRMYLLMIMEESDKRYKKLFDEFLSAYYKLKEEQKEFIRKDFKEIMNAQNERKKLKRKGEIKYE